MLQSKRPPIDRTTAETLAVQALAFIAADRERLGRFLALTGLDPAGIRAAAREPQFLAGVLDYLAGDDQLAREFARSAALDPQAITAACAALGRSRHERDLP